MRMWDFTFYEFLLSYPIVSRTRLQKRAQKQGADYSDAQQSDAPQKTKYHSSIFKHPTPHIVQHNLG